MPQQNRTATGSTRREDGQSMRPGTAGVFGKAVPSHPKPHGGRLALKHKSGERCSSTPGDCCTGSRPYSIM